MGILVRWKDFACGFERGQHEDSALLAPYFFATLTMATDR